MSRPLTLPLLLAVIFTTIAAFLQVYSVQSILPVLVRDLHATEVQAGWAVGATILAIALLSPFTGMLSDALGRKKVIAVSLLLLGILTALTALSDSIASLIVMRFLQGLSIPGITVVLLAYIGEEFSGGKMARLMSLYVTASVLGGFLGRFVTGHVGEWLGWRAACYCLAAFCLFAAAYVWRFLPESHRFRANKDIAAALSVLRRHMHNRRLLAACILGACVLFCMVGCFTYINLHLAAEPYHLNSAGLANLFGLYLIGMFITPVSAKLIAAVGNAHTVIIAVGVSATGILCTMAHHLAVIIAGLVLMSAGVFITQAATISFIAQCTREGRSLASGLYYMAYYGGGTLGAWLCGLAYAAWGWTGVACLLLCMQAAAVSLAYKGLSPV